MICNQRCWIQINFKLLCNFKHLHLSYLGSHLYMNSSIVMWYNCSDCFQKCINTYMIGSLTPVTKQLAYTTYIKTRKSIQIASQSVFHMYRMLFYSIYFLCIQSQTKKLCIISLLLHKPLKYI